MHLNSRLLFEKYAAQYFRDGMRVLEIGPDGFPSTYRSLMGGRPIEWHTLDCYDSPKLTYPSAGEYNFPVSDEAYDITFSGQVIEHVRKPWKWLPELARVTRTGGLLITINPVSWTYHEAPVDCWRIYPEGMRALYEEARVQVVLSQWESLETPQFRASIPGDSREAQSRRRRIGYSVLGRVGFPVERAYDTITIGRKGHPSDADGEGAQCL
jgi:SAM-dependent methyltransferase